MLDPVAGLPDGSASINFATFARALDAVGRIDGVYLGCCLIESPANAARLLRSGRHVAVGRWVAGYRQEIDWLDSMLVDVVFWRSSPGTSATGFDSLCIVETRGTVRAA